MKGLSTNLQDCYINDELLKLKTNYDDDEYMGVLDCNEGLQGIDCVT